MARPEKLPPDEGKGRVLDDAPPTILASMGAPWSLASVGAGTWRPMTTSRMPPLIVPTLVAVKLLLFDAMGGRRPISCGGSGTGGLKPLNGDSSGGSGAPNRLGLKDPSPLASGGMLRARLNSSESVIFIGVNSGSSVVVSIGRSLSKPDGMSRSGMKLGVEVSSFFPDMAFPVTARADALVDQAHAVSRALLVRPSCGARRVTRQGPRHLDLLTPV